MQSVEVIKAGGKQVEPFTLAYYQKQKTVEVQERMTKKKIKALAGALNLEYDEAQLTFAKKIVNAYIESLG